MADVPTNPVGAAHRLDRSPKEAPAPESDAARILSEIRARVDQDIQGDHTLSQEQQDRFRLLDMVDHLRAKHTAALNLAMDRGERMVRAESHLRQLTASGDSPVLGRVAQLERDMGRIEQDSSLRGALEQALRRIDGLERSRAKDESRLAQLDDRVRSAEYDLDPTVWSDDGVLLICSVASSTGPGGICGTSVEDEPCEEHNLTEKVRRLDLRMVAQNRDTESRLNALELNALELAQREADQSGGAPRAQVAGGSAPEPCPVTAWNSVVCIDMVCAYDLGHLSPHYNPADGGWQWDNDGHITGRGLREPTT